MFVEEVFKDVGEGEADDWHRYPLCREFGCGVRQCGVDTPDVPREDCVVYETGILPLERFGYQGGKPQGSREFPVSKVVKDLCDNFYREIWCCLMTKMRTKGFWRGRGRCVNDGWWL